MMTSLVIWRRAAAVVIAIGIAGLAGSDGGARTAPDLSRLVAVGDSLLAGYQNDSLLESQQVNGPASLLAIQAGVSLPLPLIAAPGVPNVIVEVDPGPPPIVLRAPGVSLGRLNPQVQPMNLAVPGHTVHDALVTRPTIPIDSHTDLVLGIPGLAFGVARSQVEWAEALSPSTILLWVGPNDVLRSLYVASPFALTPLANFSADYTEVVRRLAETEATLVVLNIPDITRLPYLTSALEVAQLIDLPLNVIGPILGIQDGDSITPEGLALIPPRLANPALGPLPANVVLTASEAALIRGAIAAYNEVIADVAEAYGATLVDAYGVFAAMDSRGVVVNGRLLTTAFLGGLFSLDGIHPTNTGYAIVANEIIKTMNRKNAAGIPPLSIVKIAAEDPLLPWRTPPGAERRLRFLLPF